MIRALHKTKHLNLLEDDGWVYAQRPGHRQAVAVVAVVGGRDLLLVEQHRRPVGAPTIELPAGLMDPGEDPAETALRELEEETGYRGNLVSYLPQVVSSPGLTSELTHVIRVGNLKRVSTKVGVDGEQITVHHAPLNDIEYWLRNQRMDGKYVGASIFVGLWALAADPGLAWIDRNA